MSESNVPQPSSAPAAPPTHTVRGLPMFAPKPEVVAKEKAELAALQERGLLGKWKYYFSKSGPGWLQSAQTLGAGSATASLFAGALLQYDLLWVQPLAMLLGVTMMMAMSYQALSTGMKPLAAFKTYLHPAVAYIWVAAALLATMIWHFPQYGLAAGMLEDMLAAATAYRPEDQAPSAGVLLGLACCILVIATACVWNYARGRKGIRLFENIFRTMIWLVLLAFSVVVIRLTIDGRIEWGKVARGFVGFHIPKDSTGFTIMMGAMAAAVGINMTFLFPYTLLARGWGKEHRGLSRFDLVTGMFLPYTIATALMVITAGATVYYVLEEISPSDVTDWSLVTAVGPEETVGASPGARAWELLPADVRETVKASSEKVSGEVAKLRALREELASLKAANQPTEAAEAQEKALLGQIAGLLAPEDKQTVAEGLNGLLKRPDFYQQRHYETVKVAEPAKILLKKQQEGQVLSEKEVAVMNRRLLEPLKVKEVGTGLAPRKAVKMIEASGLGKVLSYFILGFGFVGMALNAITMHMLVSGFAFCELFNVEPGGWKYRLACLMPVPGVFGAILWVKMGPYIGVPASALSGLLLPIAYVCFFVLNNRTAYLKGETPRGGVRWLWNLGMLVAIAVVTSSAAYYLYSNYGKILKLLGLAE